MKILRNNTASTIFVSTAGVTLPTGIDYTIPAQDYWLWASSDVLNEVTTSINNGNILVKDGISTLTSTQGIEYLRHLWARGQRFNNSTNGFIATDVQAAIEEAKNTAEGKARYCVSAGFDGNAAVGRYLEYNSNVDSNQSGFIVPRQSNLREQSLCVQSNSTCTWTIYTWNGTTETAITTISLTNSRKTTVTELNINLSALTELRIKLTSGSCSRPILFQFFQVV